MGPIVDFVSSALKRFDPSYGSGMNWTQRQNKLNSIVKQYNDPVEIDIDGSGFDGTQWDVCKTAIDAQVYMYAYNNYLKNLYHYDEEYIKIVLTDMQQIVRNRKLPYMYSVLGTVGSGYMSTSDGNTQRSAAYIRYAAFKSKLFIENWNFHLETNGDDVKVILERENAEKFREILYEYVYVRDLS